MTHILEITDDLPDEDKKIYALSVQADKEEQLRREEAKRYSRSRDEDSRQNSGRDMDVRFSHRHAFRGVLDLLPSTLEKMDPEYQYAWLTEKVRNQPDEEGLEHAIETGWRPVLTSELPELGMDKSVMEALGRKSSKIIRKKAMMLVKKRKESYQDDFETRNSRFTNNKLVEESVDKLSAVAGYGPLQRGKFEFGSKNSNRLNERF